MRNKTNPIRDRLRTLSVSVAGFLVHSNLLISIAATSVAFSTVRVLDLPLDPIPLFIVFAATLFVYSLNRITDIEEDETNVPSRAAFTERYGGLLFGVGIVLYLAVISGAVWFGIRGAPFLVLPAVVAALYSLLRVKRLLLVKNLIVGVSWGIIPLGVGVYYGIGLTTGVVVLSGFFTTMLTVAAAVFDIKDIEGDREEGIRTVPIVYSVSATQRGAAGVTLFVAVAVAGVVAGGIVPRQFLVLLGFLAYVAGYIPFATRDRGALFYGFIIDGEHIFLAILIVLFGV